MAGLGRTSPELAAVDRVRFNPKRQRSAEQIGVNPDIIRLMIERIRRQGSVGRGEERPTFSAFARPPGYNVPGAPAEPRVMAALLRKKKLMDEMDASRAPSIPLRRWA